MHRAGLVVSTLLAIACVFSGFAAYAEPRKRVSGPHVFKNLTLYFVHGPSVAGAVPLTLAEALDAKTVEIVETGDIHALSIENFGDTAVFVQRGEIIKGGKQDRVLSVSRLVPPRSGRLPIGAYCVEQGRWSPRGDEDARKFAAASSIVSSRCAKAPMFAGSAPLACAPTPSGEQRPRLVAPPRLSDAGPHEPSRQQAIWESVTATQDNLSKALGAQVAASQSATSLQLSLENKRLEREVDAFISALGDAIEGSDDIVGFVYAVNGKIDSGEVYGSNALFRKMWPKLLKAAATEAIAAPSEGDTAKTAPTVLKATDVEDFIRTVSTGKRLDRQVLMGLEVETRSTEDVILATTHSVASGGLLHESFIAR